MNQVVGRKTDGSSFLLLILEPGNLEMLHQERPIRVHIDDWFPDGMPKRLELTIMLSDTPVADARQFRQMAEVSLDERESVVKNVRPHCPECRSTVEQLGMWRNQSPIAIAFCPVCGCAFGIAPRDILGREER